MYYYKIFLELTSHQNRFFIELKFKQSISDFFNAQLPIQQISDFQVFRLTFLGFLIKQTYFMPIVLTIVVIG